MTARGKGGERRRRGARPISQLPLGFKQRAQLAAEGCGGVEGRAEAEGATKNKALWRAAPIQQGKAAATSLSHKS
jgi:hypothetical protein